MSNHDKSRKKARMRVLTINLGQNVKDTVDKLVAFDLFPSRSEAIRQAIAYWLPTQFTMIDKIDAYLEQMARLDEIEDNVMNRLATRIAQIEDRDTQERVKKALKGEVSKLIHEEVINGITVKEYQRVDEPITGSDGGITTYNDLPPDVQRVIDEVNARA